MKLAEPYTYSVDPSVSFRRMLYLRHSLSRRHPYALLYTAHKLKHYSLVVYHSIRLFILFLFLLVLGLSTLP